MSQVCQSNTISQILYSHLFKFVIINSEKSRVLQYVLNRRIRFVFEYFPVFNFLIFLNNMFKCEQCPSTFTRKGHWTDHQKNHNGVRFTCTVCALIFSYKCHLNRHMKNKHGMFIFNIYFMSCLV